MSTKNKKSSATLYPDLLGVVSHTVQLERWINKAGLSIASEQELRMIINRLLQASFNDATLDIFVATKQMDTSVVDVQMPDTKKMANDLEDYMDALMNETLLNVDVSLDDVDEEVEDNTKGTWQPSIHEPMLFDFSEASDELAMFEPHGVDDSRRYLSDSLLAESIDLSNVMSDPVDERADTVGDADVHDAEHHDATDLATMSVIDFEDALNEDELAPLTESEDKPSMEDILDFQSYKQPHMDHLDDEHLEVGNQDEWYQSGLKAYEEALQDYSTNDFVEDMIDFTPTVHLEGLSDEESHEAFDEVSVDSLPI